MASTNVSRIVFENVGFAKTREKARRFASHDVEDIIAVIAGRPEIVDEVRSAREDVREYVSFQCRSLLERDDLEDILAGALSSSAQLYEVVDVVQNRLTTLAGSIQGNQ